MSFSWFRSLRKKSGKKKDISEPFGYKHVEHMGLDLNEELEKPRLPRSFKQAQSEAPSQLTRRATDGHQFSQTSRTEGAPDRNIDRENRELRRRLQRLEEKNTRLEVDVKFFKKQYNSISLSRERYNQEMQAVSAFAEAVICKMCYQIRSDIVFCYGCGKFPCCQQCVDEMLNQAEKQELEPHAYSHFDHVKPSCCLCGLNWSPVLRGKKGLICVTNVFRNVVV